MENVCTANGYLLLNSPIGAGGNGYIEAPKMWKVVQHYTAKIGCYSRTMMCHYWDMSEKTSQYSCCATVTTHFNNVYIILISIHQQELNICDRSTCTVSHCIVQHNNMQDWLPCISQISPLKPGRHSHRNPSTRSRHVAPNWHGSRLQSSMSISHKTPVKPELHMQLNPLTSSMQVPPLRHRSEEQTGMSSPHKSPVKPGAHTHMNPIA